MADIQSNIQVNLDASQALAQLKALQKQIATFHASVAAASASAAKAQASLQANLINSINATGKFRASFQEIKSSSEAFTDSLERNKFSTREYFRYAGGATKTFGRLFKSEFDTIGKVAEERVKTMQTQYIKMGRSANGAIRAIAVRPLTLDMDNLATKTALAAQRQQLLNQLLKQGSTNLLNFGKNTQWAGRQLMVGFTIPLVMLGTQASKTFMSLEKQAVRFKRVYGEMFTTQQDTDKALKQVELLAKQFTKYGVAVEKTMEMAADAAATGKMGADLLAQVSEATRLAVLGGVEQQQALETTISLTNAFGVSADQLKNKINFLNAVENQTVLSIEDLTVAIPKAGPVVKQLGGNVEDLAFFMTAMKEGGINASEGANALKSGLAALINPSKKASEMLSGLGINIKQIVESNKGDIKNTVIGFAQALDTLAPLERSRAIEQLFGKFQFARLSTLFQNITKDGTQAARALDLSKASVEELAVLSERELKKVEDATGTKFRKSMEDLKVTLAPIGQQFLKAVTPIAEFIGKILTSFNNLSDGTKGAITKIVAVVGIIGPAFLMTFGLISNLIANGIKLFTNLRKGFMALGGQSKILGNQTNYMSSEQIEAATVAASLDQAHSRLIQTFKMESNAANQLAAAYQRATVAARNFAIQNPGMMKPGFKPGKMGKMPKKFAQGGIVPGVGNTDSVPAMLTPGEFVVNKQATKDNREVLNNLNKGGFVLRGTGTEQMQYREFLRMLRNDAVPYSEVALEKLHIGHGASSPTHDVLTSTRSSVKPGSELSLVGLRKDAGYTMYGPHSYNQLTEADTRDSVAKNITNARIRQALAKIPDPYPLTHKEALATSKVLAASMKDILQNGDLQNPTTYKALKKLQLSRTQIDADLRQFRNPKAWQDAMIKRIAGAASASMGEKGKDRPGYKAVSSRLEQAMKTKVNTAAIIRDYIDGPNGVKAMWHDGILHDKGMQRRDTRGDTGKGTLRGRARIAHEKARVEIASAVSTIPARTKAQSSRIANSRFAKAMIRRGIILKADGGPIPAYGEQKTVPALVTPGEMIVDRQTTQENGPLLEYINSGGKVEIGRAHV